MPGDRCEMKRSDNSQSYSGITGDRKVFSLVCPINRIEPPGLLQVTKCDSGAKFKQGDKGAA
jgi:hypothetical protein